jgi:hypothetical protein
MPTSIQGFADLPKLDLAKEKNKINLKIVRERLTSKETDQESRLDAVLRADTSEMIGTVSRDRAQVSYGELMDFITDQLKLAELPFKLKDNIVTDKNEMFQTYVFDKELTGPDGSKMVPMLIARGSYLHKLFDGKFGTYRFVCKNGVTVGTTISGVSISAQQAGDMAQMSLRDQFSLALDRFDNVVNAYEKMKTIALEPSLHELVTSDRVPSTIKKGALETLATQGFVKILDKENKVRMKLLEEEGPGAVYHVERKGTKWDLMQACTDHASHQSRSINSMVKSYGIISAFFGV